MEQVESLLDKFNSPTPRKMKSRDVGKRETVTNFMSRQNDPHVFVIPRGSTVSGTFTTSEQMTVHLPYTRKSKGGRLSKRYSRSSKRRSKRTKKTRIV